MQKWIENIPKEMSIVQNRITVYGKHHLYKGKKSVCETFEKQARGYSKFKAPYNPKRLQKFCWWTELCEHILSRTTEIAKTHL